MAGSSAAPGERRENLVMLTLDAAPSFPFFYVPHDELFFVPFDSILRIVFPPECDGVEMETNVPVFGSFVREKFRKVPVVATPAGDYYAELRISLPGVFACRFSVEEKRVESEFSFLVNPETKISSKKRVEVVPLEGMCVQTQITRCLGPLAEWDAHMKLAAHCGYNCIHFSPVQPLGISNSAYCILDHLDISHEMFQGRELLASAEERIALLHSALMGFETNYGLLSMVDVLWNHIAVNSPFLAEHPEISYNTANTPILRAPSVVDRAMIAFSTAYGAATSHRQDYCALDDNEFGDPGFSVRTLTKEIFHMLSDYIEQNPDAPPLVNPPSNVAELDHLLQLFRSSLEFARVHEFFQCDVAEELERYAAHMEINGKVDVEEKVGVAASGKKLFMHPMCVEHRDAASGIEAISPEYDSGDIMSDSREVVGRICKILKFTGERFGTSVDFELLAELHLSRKDMSMALIAMNHSIRLQVEAWLEEYVRNAGGTVQYERVGMDAPKRRMLIGRQYTLVSPYFSMIRGTGNDSKPFSCVHNGWVFHSGRRGLNGINFPTWSGGLALLTRRVIPWGDNAKLRYGRSPADCPALWDAMETYTRTMARLFHGFRIDNAHATPVHVAQRLLDVARDTNPHLFVCAELFTGSLADDRAFVRAVGVNLLIREAVHAADTGTLARFLYEAGGRRPVGSVSDLSLHCIAHPSSCENPPKPFLHRYSRDAEDLLAPPFADVSNGEVPPSSTHTPDGCNDDVEIADLRPSPVPALFYDVTHDNPSQTQLRTTEQTLSSACLLAMCVCAVGSTRGNDELFEEPVRVTESKIYPIYEDLKNDLPGIIPARAIVGKMHKHLSQAGFSEFHVEVTGSVLTVQRHNPLTHEAIFCVNLPAFRAAQASQKYTLAISGRIMEVLLSARLTMLEPYETDEVSHRAEEKRRMSSFAHAFGMELEAPARSLRAGKRIHDDKSLRSKGKLLMQIDYEAEQEDEDGFVGLVGKLEFSAAEYVQDVRVEVAVNDAGEKMTTLEVELKPGDVIIVHTALWNDAEVAYLTVEAALANQTLRYSIEHLTMSDLNVLLWKCAAEESDAVRTSTFEVPEFGRLLYAGIGSLVTIMLQKIIPGDDLGHPLCASLRGGNWLLDFMTKRLQSYIALGFTNLAPLSEWIGTMFNCLVQLPRYLIPRHFIRVVMHLFKTLVDILVDFHDASQRSIVAPDFSDGVPKPAPHLAFPFVAKKRREEFFAEAAERTAPICEPSLDQDALYMFLMLAASQFYGFLPNSRLLTRRSVSRIESEVSFQIGLVEQEISKSEGAVDVQGVKALRQRMEQLMDAKRCLGEHNDIDCPFANSIAAGLPHFAEGIMRCWGRDTCIALPGLLLVTHNFSEAANVLTGCAACVNHGLLPNLLAGGESPRFNCRDSCWWWLRAVRLYCETAPEGLVFLRRLGPRLFPCSLAVENAGLWTIADAIQEIMQCHAKGIHFREEGAGPELDSRMQDEGFNVDVTFDRNTGLVFGGNTSNCGTWMDKMGESTTAGNNGHPATPRDGCAVEIAGLLGCTLKWLRALALENSEDFSYRGVILEDGSFLSYVDWFDVLVRNFEHWFYVPMSEDFDEQHFVDRDVVRRRGIYKDTHGSKARGADYMMRPNVCVAMAVAPELFDPAHARSALEMITERLVGPLGMRTLDPDDPQFFPKYDMSDSSDFGSAKGFSYHNGPEWLWLSGFYFMALQKFPKEGDGAAAETRRWIVKRLFRARMELLRASSAFSLPELTNFNGEPCPYCCDAQAWSVGTVLETLHMLHASAAAAHRRSSQ